MMSIPQHMYHTGILYHMGDYFWGFKLREFCEFIFLWHIYFKHYLYKIFVIFVDNRSYEIHKNLNPLKITTIW